MLHLHILHFEKEGSIGGREEGRKERREEGRKREKEGGGGVSHVG